MTINWHEIPFFRLVIPLILGIASAIYLDASIPYVWLFILTLTGLVIGFQIFKLPFHLRKINGISILVTLFLLGYQLAIDANQLRQAHHFSNFLAASSKTTFIAQIEEIPIAGKWTKCKSTVQYLDSQSVCGDVILYIKTDSLSQTLQYGDVIAINGYLNKIPLPKNPNQFDYSAYLHFQNIHYQSFVAENSWSLIAKEQGNSFFTTLFHLRKNCLSKLKYYLSEESYSVGAALILGYREALTDDIQNAYADTGAIHVLAVSGLHVGIIALILKYLLGFMLGKNPKFRAFQPPILITFLWLFAFLTGGSPSVLRADTMFSFVTYGLYINRKNSVYNNLAISAFLLLIWNPYLIMAVGFQLSYLAVLGIVYFQPKIAKLWYIKHKLLRYFWLLTTVAIGAQIGTLPVSLYYFHQFPLLFMLSGVIVIPAASLILGLGILTIISSFIHVSIGQPFGWLLDKVIWLMNQLIFQIQKIPINKVEGIHVDTWMMLLIFGCIFGLIYTIQIKANKRGKGILISLSALLVLVATASFRAIESQRQQEITVYSIYKKSAIDIIDGNTAYTLVSSDFDKKTYDFNIKNYHTKIGIRQKNQLTLTDTIQTKNVFYNGSILYFNQTTILILSPNIEWKKISKLKVDAVIVTGNPYLKIKELAKHIHFNTIIFDASNHQKSVKYWMKDAQQLQLNAIDVGKEGYYKYFDN